jgi:dihydrofolate reductase
MRKLKLQVQMTLDGFIAGPNGEMDWITFNWDDDLKRYVKELTDPVDCIVLGRRLAEGFIPHWASNPAGEDPEGIAKMNNATKVVFSKTLNSSEWPNTILAKGDLVDEITKLKKQHGQDIIVYGGATFVSSLINERLIDEFHIFINPVAIGHGMAIFKDLGSKQEYKLNKSKSFGCGIVVHNYELKHN